MTIVARTTSAGKISVTQGSQSSGAIVVKKAGALTIESLQNVNSTNLQDGYTLVYDSDTDKWITQQFDAAIGNVDGGTY